MHCKITHAGLLTSVLEKAILYLFICDEQSCYKFISCFVIGKVDKVKRFFKKNLGAFLFVYFPFILRLFSGFLPVFTGIAISMKIIEQNFPIIFNFTEKQHKQEHGFT